MSKEQETLEMLELYGRFLELFSRGLRLAQGLNDMEKSLLKKYGDVVLEHYTVETKGNVE